MASRNPPYGWHSTDEGCYTEKCSKSKLRTITFEIINPTSNKSSKQTNIIIECSKCLKEYELSLVKYRGAVKRGNKNFYCSNECVGLASRKSENNEHNCQKCGKQFYRKKKLGEAPKYCSLECAGLTKKDPSDTQYFIANQCAKCDKKFTRAIHTGHQSKYCSRECARLDKQGKYFPLLPRIRNGEAKYCPKCKVNEIFNREASCLDCRYDAQFGVNSKDNYSIITLQDLRDRYTVYQYHAKVRGHSRSIYKLNRGEMTCKECGYDKHVDIAHIKNVKDFSMDTIVSEVNSMVNLVALCKNHHWEFDNPTASFKKQHSSLLTNRNIVTLGELKTQFPSNFGNKLRTDSRSVYLNSGGPRCCKECGYVKRIDVCHVRDVKDFPVTALVSEVNAVDNLVALCPRDHWEFDHGLLVL